MRAVRALLTAVLVLAPAACHVGREADADPVEYHLDQEFVLGGGREAAISGEDLRLRFAGVLEDSRCPTEVECFWTGQARIAVVAQPSERAPTTVEFNTNPAPGQNVRTAKVDGFRITLKSLEPYPRTPGDAISLQDYTATMSVHKG